MKVKSFFNKGGIHALKEASKEKFPYFVELLKEKFIILENVFSPKYFPDTLFYASSFTVNKGERFCEIGCGTGVMAVFAALRGAKEVVAVDINPFAVKNTIENVALHNLSSKIKVLESDIFSNLSGEMFDTIMWNFPFGNSKKKNLSLLEQSLFDPEYKSFARFVKESKSHLLPKGRLLIGFSKDIGFFDELNTILAENNFSYKIISDKVSTQSHVSSTPVSYQLIEARLSK